MRGSGGHLEVALFETGVEGEILRTLGRTGDPTAVAAALDGIARDVSALRGGYPAGGGGQVRPLRGVSDAPQR